MEGDKKVIQYLNTQLKDKLITIDQYLLYTHMYGRQGPRRIGDHKYKESIGEMERADRLIEYILVLDGLSNLQDLGKILIGQDTKEIIECNLKFECAAHGTVVEGTAHYESIKDCVSRETLVGILDDIKEHIDWSEMQLELTDKVGTQNYLQLQTEPEGEQG